MRRNSAYRVFLTRNTEYHVRGHVCIGVRDRRSGAWFKDHPALTRPCANCVVQPDGRLSSPHLPSLGDPLEFDVNGRPLRTSPVLDIEEREAVDAAGGMSDRPHSMPSPLSRRPERAPRVTR